MSGAPRVTICFPTIGRLQFFEDAKRSLARQTLTDYEVLVLDNACPEDTRRALVSWAEQDSRIRILRADPRIPMWPNFNRGIEAARGEYLAFHFDDDIYKPRLLEEAVVLLERNPRAGFAGSNFDFIDERGAVMDRRRWVKRTEYVAGRRYIETLFRKCRNPIPMQGLVYRRAVLGAKGLDTSIQPQWGDFVVLMRIAEKHDVAMLSEPLVEIRKHSEAASSSMQFSRSIPLRTEVLLSYCDEYLARWPEDQGFVEQLRRHATRNHRIGLVWGWMSADESAEAEACLEHLGSRAIDQGVARILGQAARVGLRPSSRARTLVDLGRKVRAVSRI